MVIEGVIRPPPEIRAVADRTALYVAKNGRAFEKRILGSDKGKTPKFAFLHTTSPFHAYYEQRIQFYENGGEDEKEDEKAQEEKEKEEKTKEKGKESGVRKEDKTQKASVLDPIALALLAQRSKISQFRAAQEEAEKAADDNTAADSEQKRAVTAIPAPAPLQFVNIVAPSSLSVAQIEQIQLVAQFTALDGKNGSFLSQLSLREWNNPEFAFCQPRHGHFAYFSALVDAYRYVLGLWTAGSAANDGIKDLANNVEKCLEVAAYRAEYERDREEYQRNRADVASGAQIDWHDFVVVETIDFPAEEVVEISMVPPPPPPRKEVAAEEEAMEESEGEEEDEQIRVVPSYTPKVVASHAAKVDTVIDPITGKSILVKDMPEHMRIQLLDPKWAEERRKFQEKQKDSNLVSGEDMASYLARFAQARGDTFGKKEQDLLSKESDSKKRLEEANRVIREQAQSTVGPSLPSSAVTRPSPPTEASLEPAAKRARVDEVTHVPAPPIPTTHVAPPPPAAAGVEDTAPAAPEEPFAAVATGSVATTKETSSILVPEAEFAASLSKPEVTLQIRVPNDRAQMAWNFYGQILSLSVNVMSTVKSVKQELSRLHLNEMPPNKIQLKNVATGMFLKDSMTLATLNIGPTATMELIPKTRGGRK